MENKQRIPAFTIMEITVAMLISAVVIAITYTALNIVSRSYAGFSQRNGEMAMISRLDELLRRDFVRSDAIYRETDVVIFNQDRQTVKYSFLPEQIIRYAAVADTFAVKSEDLKLYFERQQLPVDFSTEPEPNRIDELEFTALYKDEKFPYHYLKEYSSENMIKRSPNAIH